jgi:kynurenine formamidase
MAESIAAIRSILQKASPGLLAHENVVATGVGYKLTGGRRTPTPAIICSVTRKVPSAALAASTALGGGERPEFRQSVPAGARRLPGAHSGDRPGARALGVRPITWQQKEDLMPIVGRLFVASLALAIGGFWTLAAHGAEQLKRKLEATRVVDLTHKMHDAMAYWPGGVPFKKTVLVDYRQGYLLHKFEMGENTGTHVDAPAHFVRGKKAIDQLALPELTVSAVVIDVRDKAKANPDYQLSAGDVQSWEAKHGKIPGGSLVILNTGWHRRFADPKKYINMDAGKVMHFPGFGPDSAKLLVERNVAGIGIDTLSIDFGASKDFKTHLVMLGANKYQIENLANLDELPPKGATVFVGVLPVRGGSQAQARVVAFLP